jgi:hypothetical protein
MGGSASKMEPPKKEASKFDKFKASVEDEIARRMMMQREVQMAVNIARARDTLCVFGSAWGTLVTGVVTARALGHKGKSTMITPEQEGTSGNPSVFSYPAFMLVQPAP